MAVDLLTELVRCYSPSRHEAPAVNLLVEWMRSSGFDAHVDEAGNAVGVRGDRSAERTLLLLGHIDTYPGEIPVRVEDDVLFGRGSVDAKGSLATFAAAAAQSQIPDGWRVMVVGAVEEEIATSRGAYHLCETQPEPALCIIGEPSGADRVTLGYKGRLLVDYKLVHPNVHTARPEPSVAAVGAAFWQRILDWATEINAGHERYFDQLMPDLRDINTQSDHFNETVELTVGFRLPPQLTPEDVSKKLRDLAEEDAELRFYSAERTYRGARNNPLVRGMTTAIRAQGDRPGFVLKTGTSDMNVVGAKWTCPIVAYGPGDSNLDHTPNEHLPLAEYERAIAVLRHFIAHLGS